MILNCNTQFEVYTFSKFDTVLNYSMCPSFEESIKRIQDLFVASVAKRAIIICRQKGKVTEKFSVIKGE